MIQQWTQALLQRQSHAVMLRRRPQDDRSVRRWRSIPGGSSPGEGETRLRPKPDDNAFDETSVAVREEARFLHHLSLHDSTHSSRSLSSRSAPLRKRCLRSAVAAILQVATVSAPATA